MLVQIGNQNQWVNPRYVTSVEDCIMGEIKSKLWVVGNAGYGTYCIFSKLAPCEVAAKLNEVSTPNEQEEQKSCTWPCCLEEGECPRRKECDEQNEKG